MDIGKPYGSHAAHSRRVTEAPEAPSAHSRFVKRRQRRVVGGWRERGQGGQLANFQE